MINIAIHREGSSLIERVVEVPSLECSLDETSRKRLGLPRSYADEQCGDGESWTEVSSDVDGATHYIDVETLQAVGRKRLAPQYSIDGLTVRFACLPAGTVIGVAGQQVVADGDDEVEVDVPGTYRIALSHPHYLDDVVEVTLE